MSRMVYAPRGNNRNKDRGTIRINAGCIYNHHLTYVYFLFHSMRISLYCTSKVMHFKSVIFYVVNYISYDELFSRIMIALCALSIKYVLIGPRGIKWISLDKFVCRMPTQNLVCTCWVALGIPACRFLSCFCTKHLESLWWVGIRWYCLHKTLSRLKR
jgi:hypothetical protein